MRNICFVIKKWDGFVQNSNARTANVNLYDSSSLPPRPSPHTFITTTTTSITPVTSLSPTMASISTTTATTFFDPISLSIFHQNLLQTTTPRSDLTSLTYSKLPPRGLISHPSPIPHETVEDFAAAAAEKATAVAEKVEKAEAAAKVATSLDALASLKEHISAEFRDLKKQDTNFLPFLYSREAVFRIFRNRRFEILVGLVLTIWFFHNEFKIEWVTSLAALLEEILIIALCLFIDPLFQSISGGIQEIYDYIISWIHYFFTRDSDSERSTEI
ncbi:hypothetical protein LINGRAHAP2_LOCUS7645 [Linum grandiflorum]